MPRRIPHQAYALRHLDKAVNRLIVATTPMQKAEAGRWARLWARAAGQPFDRPQHGVHRGGGANRWRDDYRMEQRRGTKRRESGLLFGADK